jgi:hypothetical protein
MKLILDFLVGVSYNVSTLNERTNIMINPIPKLGIFASLDSQQVAAMISTAPPGQQAIMWRLYYGTVNMCHDLVSDAMEDIDGIRDTDRPVIINCRPDW